jgi:hypothetical protein
MTTNARAASIFVVQGLMLEISGVKAKEKFVVTYVVEEWNQIKSHKLLTYPLKLTYCETRM